MGVLFIEAIVTNLIRLQHGYDASLLQESYYYSLGVVPDFITAKSGI